VRDIEAGGRHGAHGDDENPARIALQKDVDPVDAPDSRDRLRQGTLRESHNGRSITHAHRLAECFAHRRLIPRCREP
jgi:hypothetical protein